MRVSPQIHLVFIFCSIAQLTESFCSICTSFKIGLETHHHFFASALKMCVCVCVCVCVLRVCVCLCGWKGSDFKFVQVVGNIEMIWLFCSTSTLTLREFAGLPCSSARPCQRTWYGRSTRYTAAKHVHARPPQAHACHRAGAIRAGASPLPLSHFRLLQLCFPWSPAVCIVQNCKITFASELGVHVGVA
jgi:hypothetical protein